MKRIALIVLTAAALLVGCKGEQPVKNTSSEGNGSLSQTQGARSDAPAGEGSVSQPAGELSQAGAASSQTEDGPEPEDGSQPVQGNEQGAMAAAMLEAVEGRGDIQYARLIDMDGSGTPELLVATADMDCWAWQWTGSELSLITLGGPIDRGNDGQMGGITDQVSLVQAPDGAYGVLCRGSTDLTFYTYRFLDHTECYEDRIFDEWIDSPEYDENAPDPENYYYRNGEPVTREEFEQGVARYAEEEPVSQPFDGGPWSSHMEETLKELESLKAA